MSRAEIKQRAKDQLGNNIFGSNWLIAVVVVLVFAALSSIPSIIPAIGAAALIIIEGPLTFGMTYQFLKQARDGMQMNIGDLFVGFNYDFGQLLLLNLLQNIFIALWSCLLVVPGIIKAYAYSMSFYIKADHPEYDWRQCINESKAMMYGHKWELFVLDLSFIGWMIVGTLCLGIGTLWVTAYQMAARAQFYESIKPVEAIPEYTTY